MGLPQNKDDIYDEEINELLSKSANNAKQKPHYVNNGTYISRSNILLFPGGKIIAIASLALVAFMLVKYDFTGSNDISVSQADEIKRLVKMVSKCENKTTMKVYGELRGEHNVLSLKKIPTKTYHKIIAELEKRNCQPPIQEAFLLPNTTIAREI